MKYIQLFFTSFLIVFTFYAKAQSFKPMLGGSSEWSVVNCNNGTNCLVDYYSASEDTVMNGKTYYFLDFFHYNKNFALREETGTGKVYLTYQVAGNWVKEVLLYDFSLQVGETVNIQNPISPAPPLPGVYVVDSIKYRTYYLDTRKVLYLSGPDTSLGIFNYPIWIEGVGSMSLINTPGSGPNMNGSGELMCFYRNGELVYRKSVNDIDSCNSQFVSIKEVEQEVNPLKVFYKGTEHKLQIVSTPSFIPTWASLYDLKGRLFKEFQLSPQPKQELYVSPYISKGIFILKVGNQEKTICTKLAIGN